MPNVLIDTQGVHPVVPALVIGHRLQFRLHPTPQGPPVDAQLTGQAVDVAVLPADLVDRPPGGPGREPGPGRGHTLVLLGERPGRAVTVGTGPGAFAPPQHHGTPEAGTVGDLVDPPAVGDRDHPTRGATHRPGR